MCGVDGAVPLISDKGDGACATRNITTDSFMDKVLKSGYSMPEKKYDKSAMMDTCADASVRVGHRQMILPYDPSYLKSKCRDIDMNDDMTLQLIWCTGFPPGCVKGVQPRPIASDKYHLSESNFSDEKSNVVMVGKSFFARDMLALKRALGAIGQHHLNAQELVVVGKTLSDMQPDAERVDVCWVLVMPELVPHVGQMLLEQQQMKMQAVVVV